VETNDTCKSADIIYMTMRQHRTELFGFSFLLAEAQKAHGALGGEGRKIVALEWKNGNMTYTQAHKFASSACYSFFHC
jgi:hypothetical protein